MSFQQTIEEAESLSSRCLCHPWNETEAAVLRILPEWQKRIVSFANSAQNGNQNFDFATFQTGITQALSGISKAMTQKNAVLLSNTLSDQLIPVLKAKK